MANIIRLGGGGGGSQPTLITKSITQNGTYNASSEGADGYSSVTVNVSGGQSKQISYLKWKINNTRSNPATNAIQMAEFNLYLNNVLYDWNENVSITASLNPVSANESIDHIIDGSSDTKFVSTGWGGSSVGQCEIVISLGETITVDNSTTYAYITANDETSRDPAGWALFGSADGQTWFVLDARSGANIPTARKTSTEKFNFTVA